MIKNSKEEKVILKEKRNLAKKEEKFIRKREIVFIKEKLDPLKSKVEEKIPERLAGTINKTFEKGFYYIFAKGTSIIEKSYDINEIKLEADVNKYRLSKELSSKNLSISRLKISPNENKNIELRFIKDYGSDVYGEAIQFGKFIRIMMNIKMKKKTIIVL